MKKASSLQIILMNLYNLTTSLFCSFTVLFTPYLTYGALSYIIVSLGTFMYNTLDNIVEKDVLYKDYTRSYEIKSILINIMLGYMCVLLHHFYINLIINLFLLIQK